MKEIVWGFFRRGMSACGIGPLVLVVLYLILQGQGTLQTLTVHEVCVGIVSITALAFVAGGMNVVYQVEQLPLMTAIFMHGTVLYISYLLTYLVNGWLGRGVLPLLVFTAIFVVGYLVIWGIIWCMIRKRTARVNEMLKMKQSAE